MVMNTTKNNSVAFAYFKEGKFLGWYADTFGSLRDCPKLYSNTDSQSAVIEKNFQRKLRKVNETSFDEAKTKTRGVLDAFDLFTYDSEDKLRGSDVELRQVQTPFYDGENPNFSRKVEKKFRKKHYDLYHTWCKEFGLDPGKEKGDNFGIGLVENFKTFEKTYPRKHGKNWLYADYKEVREWAELEPTEFLKTFKYEKL
jgi:hypothetical protein